MQRETNCSSLQRFFARKIGKVPIFTKYIVAQATINVNTNFSFFGIKILYLSVPECGHNDGFRQNLGKGMTRPFRNGRVIFRTSDDLLQLTAIDIETGFFILFAAVTPETKLIGTCSLTLGTGDILLCNDLYRIFIR